jgi:putative ABC transport system permease protein
VQAGEPVAVVLSDLLWRTRFSGDRAVVGRSIRLGADSATVIGVAPAGLLTIGDRTPMLWRNARIAGTDPNGSRSAGRNMFVLARLKRGVSLEAADKHMTGLARSSSRNSRSSTPTGARALSPLAEEMAGKVRTPLFVMLGAVACVLLIACANVANLLLTRAAGRGRELAVRMSLGATRWALIRQLLAESLTLAVAGGALGLGLGWWLLEVLKATGPRDLRRLETATLDPGVLAFTFGLTLLTGVLLGLAPALTATRRALSVTMRDGARGATAGSRANTIREAFTVAEVALSLVLLAGAGLLLKSFVRLTAVDPGFRTGNVLTANLSLRGDRYRDQKGVQFFAELNRRVRAIPAWSTRATSRFCRSRGWARALTTGATISPNPRRARAGGRRADDSTGVLRDDEHSAQTRPHVH